MNCPNQDILDAIFPPERADAFFDAMFGGAEEGAYDIRLICERASADSAELAFELNCRPGKCLRCSLTYGLPDVFECHPVIAIAKVARAVADALGWQGDIQWELGRTEEDEEDRHIIPFLIRKV